MALPEHASPALHPSREIAICHGPTQDTRHWAIPPARPQRPVRCPRATRSLSLPAGRVDVLPALPMLPRCPGGRLRGPQPGLTLLCHSDP
jgi:hypothetical protein